MDFSDEGADAALEAKRVERKPASLFYTMVAILFLVLGVGLGFMLSLLDEELIINGFNAIIVFLLALLAFFGILAAFLFRYRQRLLSGIFNKSEIELQHFAQPLSDVARFAADRDVGQATRAAKDFGEILLARYAWTTSRRWLLGSITGIIASIAALAGSVLLLKQNTLIEKQNEAIATQTVLLEKQNEAIDAQLPLLEQQTRFAEINVELAEADRSAFLGPDMVKLSEELGAIRQGLFQEGRVDIGRGDIPLSLQYRIIFTSVLARPYRFLQFETPNVIEQVIGIDKKPKSFLTEKPASIERGLIVSILRNSGFKDFSLLNSLGLNLSSAVWPASSTNRLFQDMDFTVGIFEGTFFDEFTFVDVNFSGAVVSNANFRGATLRNVSFNGYQSQKVGLKKVNAFFTDFSESYLENVDFSDAAMQSSTFSKAILNKVSFNRATLAGVRFQDSILIDPDFTRANLLSGRLDGAVVNDANFLETLANAGPALLFDPNAFELKPLFPLELPADVSTKASLLANKLKLSGSQKNLLTEILTSDDEFFRVVRKQTEASPAHKKILELMKP